MNIGKLRHRITLLRQIRERDSFGAETGIWKPLKKCWASIKTAHGREYMGNDQIKAEAEVEVFLRYLPGITVKDRIKYMDKTYEILSVIDRDFKHTETMLKCKEII